MSAEPASVTGICTDKIVAKDTRNAVCFLCGTAIAAGAPLAIRKVKRPCDTYTMRRVVCLSCSPGWGKGHPTFYCKTCERPVYYAKRTNLPRYCCWRCQYIARLVCPVSIACSVCGKTFTPPRTDARTCSPACRQKAYRRRQQGAVQ